MLLIVLIVLNKIKFAIFLLVLTSCSSFVLAQTEIRLAPGFGVQTVQSYVKEDFYADERFRAYNFSTTPTYNLSIQLERNNSLLVFTSLSSAKSAISYKYGDTGENTYTDGSCTSLSLGVQKKISTHKWFKMPPKKKLNNIFDFQANKNSNHYLLLFKLKFISGISHDWVANFPGTQIFRNTSTSLFLGFGLQFFDQDKDKLQLNFIYSQGLKEISEQEVEYIYNGKHYFGKIGSKGSYFAVQVSYPLRLITLKEKRSNQSKYH